MLKLGTIEEEAALCREANKDAKIGDLVLHLHHEGGCEPLTIELNRESHLVHLEK